MCCMQSTLRIILEQLARLDSAYDFIYEILVMYSLY